jgi:DNA-binding NarL/FixJ family response regulator
MLMPGSWIMPFFGSGTEEILAAIRSLVQEESAFPAGAPCDDVSPSALTPRETEVLRLLAGGRTSREIAAELSLSIRTVGRHITNIYTKIGARTRADATAYAIRRRVV